MWSAYTGEWRRLCVRPWRRLHTGYGYRPSAAVGLGLTLIVVTVPFWPFAYVLTQSPRDGWGSLDASDVAGRALASVLVVLLPSGLLLLGLGAAARGVADLVTGRRTVEGHVLRLTSYSGRAGGGRGLTMWWVVVDDGSGTTVRPWALLDAPTFTEGAVIRARVTRRLGHVKDVEVVTPAPR